MYLARSWNMDRYLFSQLNIFTPSFEIDGFLVVAISVPMCCSFHKYLLVLRHGRWRVFTKRDTVSDKKCCKIVIVFIPLVCFTSQRGAVSCMNKYLITTVIVISLLSLVCLFCCVTWVKSNRWRHSSLAVSHKRRTLLRLRSLPRNHLGLGWDSVLQLNLMSYLPTFVCLQHHSCQWLQGCHTSTFVCVETFNGALLK